jgi:hypothetical protein
MKHFIPLIAVLSFSVISTCSVAAQWKCLYATYDATLNGTGENTPSVGVISENMFVALVMTPNIRNFMIPYVNADSSHGRVNFWGYDAAPTSGKYQVWTDGGFDQVQLLNAAKLIARPDSLIYVANNDPEHNILIFKFTGDTVKAVSPFRRQPTGTKGIFGIAVDNNGYVYVANDTSNGVTDDIKIYKPISQWNDSHTDQPVRTINLPDGVYRGLTVSPNGASLFISDATNRKILKFTGSPTTGYTQSQTFSFQLGAADTVEGTTLLPIPINLGYFSSNNILFAAVDVHGYSSGTYGTYNYGRIYLLNPNTGALVSQDSSISIINQAKWNLQITGGYNLRGDGTAFGTASGYTSTYDVAFDQKGNVYSQSHFGWTVEKWKFNGTLPTIVTGVEVVPFGIPESFSLDQNYPNPFNPSTTISFSVPFRSNVTLRIYDLLGREVRTLVNNESLEPGKHRVDWNGRDRYGEGVASGMYFYKLEGKEFSITRQMVLMK